MSKFVMVQFPDATDISSLAIDSVVKVGTVAGGTVIMNGNMQEPPEQELIPHAHAVLANTANVPAAMTGDATPI